MKNVSFYQVYGFSKKRCFNLIFFFRFLNSLIVSKNGKVCVCGDQTQKPSPLLVWDLTSRKLMYDLRIPHHEFLTKLAAITDDGNYVVCVSKVNMILV